MPDAAITPPAGPFACTEVVGMGLSSEWYNRGFQAALGTDLGNKWQGRFAHYGYVSEYAKPDSYAWTLVPRDTDPTDVALTAPCMPVGTTPDRVVFQAWSWDLTSEEAWVTNLEAALATIRARRPGVKRIDLMTIIRCPMNGWCHPNQPQFGPGANFDPERQDCHVPEFVDTAFAKVAANHPDLVSVTPKFEGQMCGTGGPTWSYLGDAYGPVAQAIAAYYRAMP